MSLESSLPTSNWLNILWGGHTWFSLFSFVASEKWLVFDHRKNKISLDFIFCFRANEFIGGGGSSTSKSDWWNAYLRNLLSAHHTSGWQTTSVTDDLTPIFFISDRVLAYCESPRLYPFRYPNVLISISNKLSTYFCQVRVDSTKWRTSTSVHIVWTKSFTIFFVFRNTQSFYHRL